VEHAWFSLDRIADTIYFPGGKPNYVNSIQSGNLYETGYELYPSGIYRQKWVRDDRDGNYEIRQSFYPDGRKESYSFHRKHGIHDFEETLLFYPDGRLKQRDRSTAGLWHARQNSKSWYADGNLSSTKTIRRGISLFHRKHSREKVKFKSWYPNRQLRIKTQFTEAETQFWTKIILHGHVAKWEETGKKTEHRRLNDSDKPADLLETGGDQRVHF
jgi:antitoxin component YwqK of YwqJK toxin-antitoxin module